MRQFKEVRKKRILKFLSSYFSKNKYMPTLREIAKKEEISIERIRVLLNELKKEKKIQRKKYKYRSVKIL